MLIKSTIVDCLLPSTISIRLQGHAGEHYDLIVTVTMDTKVVTEHIRRILTAPDVDLATISSKKVRKVLAESFGAVLVKENKEVGHDMRRFSMDTLLRSFPCIAGHRLAHHRRIQPHRNSSRSSIATSTSK